MRLNAKQIELYTGGQTIVEALDPSAIMTGITWDSRDCESGWLFVALEGERVDGHDFVDDVLRKGAKGILVTHGLPEATYSLAREMGACIIEVSNTESAITDLAREWRKALRGRVIAVTGSVGKTTTKNLVRDVLAARYSVVATRANQNNELGVPKTLLAANPETQVIVVEMGMRGKGQITELCRLAQPDWGVVTNVGECHIELLGSQLAIAQAKAELLSALPDRRGMAFVNGDDAWTDTLIEEADLISREVPWTLFGGVKGEHLPRVWAEDMRLDEQGRPAFTLCAQGFSDERAQDDSLVDATIADDPLTTPLFPLPKACRPIEKEACTVGLRGEHNMMNACAAAAVGRAMGLSLSEIAAALHEAIPESGRAEVLATREGVIVMHDAYNANPDSMRAALKTFCALAVSGRRIAVLGDMGELGEYARACHESIGAFAARLPLDELVCVGDLAGYIAEGARDAGMDAASIVREDGVAGVLAHLESSLDAGDAVLVKASHFMGLERVVEGLVS